MLVVFIYHLQCLRKITYIHKYQLSQVLTIFEAVA